MISIFRKNDVVNIFLLLPYAILLRLYSLLYPSAYAIAESDTNLMRFVFNLIPHPIVQSTIAIVLIFAQAIIINLLANDHRLHRTPSALGGMFYILLVSCIPEFQGLSPALFGMTFILIAIFNVFRTYKMSAAASSIFNAALSVSAATLIYPPYSLAAIALFIGLAMMRNFSLKERLQFMVGFGVLLWICGVLLYYFDLLSIKELNLIGFLSVLDRISFTDTKSLWTLGSLAFLISISLVNYYNFMKKKGIDIRKKLDFFYWLMLSSLLSLIFFIGIDYQHYYFIAASLSLFLSMAVILIPNKALAEILYLIVLAGIFTYQFG